MISEIHVVLPLDHLCITTGTINMTDRTNHITVTIRWSLRLLRCLGGVSDVWSPMRHPVLRFDVALLREYSRAVPTARSEVVIAVKPQMIDAINDIFSNICVPYQYSIAFLQKLLYIKQPLYFNSQYYC